jgi:hypothetical protein
MSSTYDRSADIQGNCSSLRQSLRDDLVAWEFSKVLKTSEHEKPHKVSDLVGFCE